MMRLTSLVQHTARVALLFIGLRVVEATSAGLAILGVSFVISVSPAHTFNLSRELNGVALAMGVYYIGLWYLVFCALALVLTDVMLGTQRLLYVRIANAGALVVHLLAFMLIARSTLDVFILPALLTIVVNWLSPSLLANFRFARVQ